MARRAATTVGVAGLGLAGVLAGTVLLSGPTATAAVPCSATATPSPTATTAPSQSATTEPSEEPSEEPTEEPTESTSPTTTPAPTEAADGSLVGQVVDLLPLGEGQGTTTATPSSSPEESESPEPEETTATASPTASPKPLPPTSLSIAPRLIVKGDSTRVTGKGLPGCKVVLYAATRPSTTYRAVRSGTIADNGTFAWTIYPPSNTKVYAKSQGSKDSGVVGVNVRYVVTEKLTRTGTRTYRFEGTLSPAKKGVKITVYRTNKTGTFRVGEALTSSQGTWSFVKTFSGTGNFNFYAVAPKTADNESNRSRLVNATIR